MDQIILVIFLKGTLKNSLLVVEYKPPVQYNISARPWQYATTQQNQKNTNIQRANWMASASAPADIRLKQNEERGERCWRSATGALAYSAFNCSSTRRHTQTISTYAYANFSGV